MICRLAATAWHVPRRTESREGLPRLPACGGILLVYGGAPFRADRVPRDVLIGIVAYLGAPLGGAARAHALLLGDRLLPSS